MMEGPLTELRNQRLPRRKMVQTYGKKKTGKIGTTHRDLFGVDENEIDQKLADLNLEESKTPAPIPKTFPTLVPQAERGLEKKTKSAKASVSPTPSLISPEDRDVLDPLLALAERDVVLFSDFSPKLAKSMVVEKIGEGSFAEVFKLTSKEKPSSKIESVLAAGTIVKVIPLNTPSSDPNTIDRLSSVISVAREIKVLRTLDSVHGFTRFRGVRIVTGLWPRPFLDAFRTFRRNHKQRALNGAPDDDFDERQIYALVEMEDAGAEISLLKKPSVFQVHDLFWMTVVVLAIAEEQVQFEHRDLHMSNICVKPLVSRTKQAKGSAAVDDDDDSEASETQDRLDIDRLTLATMSDTDIPAIKLGLSNIQIAVIDYTVARCNLTPTSPTPTPIPTQASEIAYDPMRFLSTQEMAHDVPGADAEARNQLATYRKTKAAVKHAQRTTNHVGDKWSQFVPRTNVIWLGYLLQTLSRRAKGRTKRYHVVKGSSKVARRLQEDMWDTLAEVEDVVLGVDPDEDADGYEPDAEVNDLGNVREFSDAELERTPGSARELVDRAVRERWLSQDEIDVLMANLERVS